MKWISFFFFKTYENIVNKINIVMKIYEMEM